MMRRGRQTRTRLRAQYTVEAAGVMGAVLLTILTLLSAAFHIHAEVVGAMKLHTEVEQERHKVESSEEREVSRQGKGSGWELEITSPVYRPENLLRLWSLMEGKQ